MQCFFQRSTKIPFIKFGSNIRTFKVNTVYSDKNPSLADLYISNKVTFNNYLSFVRSQSFSTDVDLFKLDLSELNSDIKLPFIIGNTSDHNLGRTDIDLIDGISSIFKNKKDIVEILISIPSFHSHSQTVAFFKILKCIDTELKFINVDFRITLTSISSLEEYYQSFISKMNLNHLFISDIISLDKYCFYDFFLTTEQSFNIDNLTCQDFFNSICKCFNYTFNEKYLDEKYFEIENLSNDYFLNVFNRFISNKNKTIYFNHQSSDNIMSNECAASLIQKLLDNKYNVVIYDEDYSLDIKHDNLLELSRYSTSIFDLYHIINICDYCISVDSLPIYFADVCQKKSILLYNHNFNYNSMIDFMFDCVFFSNYNDNESFIEFVNNFFRKNRSFSF